MSARVRVAALWFIAVFARTSLADPSPQDLQAQIDQLKQQIARLEAATQPTLDSRVVDATVDKVLADAEKRSTPLADVSGFTAGYNGHFIIQSADGNFSFSP